MNKLLDENFEDLQKEFTNPTTPLEWDDPVPFDDIETPEIPAYLLPGIIGEFAQALATETETPEALSLMLILSVLSAVCSQKLRISPKPGWNEPCNIYTLIALPPGNGKSHVLNACTQPLVEWQQEESQRLEPEIKRIKSELKSKEKIIDAVRGQLSRITNPLEQAAKIEEIKHLELALPAPPIPPHLFANDATPESLADQIHQQKGKFAILSDEGGITETMSGLYNGGNANIDILLKGIDGGHVRIIRKDRQIDLNPNLTIGLTTQPVILLRMAEKRAFQSRGLLERFLWVLPKSKVGYRRHDTPSVPESIRSNYREFIKALITQFQRMQEEPYIVLTLSPEAKQAWRAFQGTIEIELRHDGRLASCSGWGSKLCGFVLRIAGLLHVAEYGYVNSIISHDSMERALTLAELLIDHAIAAYGFMGVDPATSDAKIIWKWIQSQKKPFFSRADVTYAMRNNKLDQARITQALQICTERNLISDPEKIIGTKTIRYYVNPRIFEI